MSTTRRDFLKASLGASTLVSLLPTIPAFLGQTAQADEHKDDSDGHILVVVQLAGGNDGLNTVVPYADDNYARNRTTLRLRGNQVHKIDALLGFHPKMSGMARLYQEGLLSVVQGVGYPNPNGSHEVSMRIWQTAEPEDPECQTGWLGRLADSIGDDRTDMPELFVGQINPPLTINGRRVIVPRMRSLQDGIVRPVASGPNTAHRRLLDQASQVARPSGNDKLLDFVCRGTATAYASSRKIEAVTGGSSGAEYPSIEFAGMLRAVAQLIRADLGVRVFYTELGGEEPGGFDTHAGQRDNHAALLHQLSESIAAFAADLKRDGLLDRVLLMTFSEFGRTVAENGRRGTDHGSAAPLLLVGGKLRGGLVGEHPNLTDLEAGGQKHHTDFRRVYATLLDRWLAVDSQAVLGVKFEPLAILRG
jgi:uncharacterized protein (DUF1501 family)